LSFSYAHTDPLFDNFSLAVARNDRIGVIGKNGKGKSTLLKVLAGELQPLNGSIRLHHAASVGYFGQVHIDLLHDNNTVEEELGSVAEGLTKQNIMDVCGTIMLGGDLSSKRVGVLSGGERSRVLLGKILLMPVNLLVLDEPTNHLDMESCDSLISAIDRFEGAVLIATHNEMFLHTLTTRLIVFDGPGPFLFEGSYQDFLDRLGWEDERDSRVRTDHGKRQQPFRRELRAKRAEIINERSQALRQIEKRIAELEERIESVDKGLADNNRAIIDASAAGNSESIVSLSRENHRLRNSVDALYTELEELLHKRERVAAKFEEKLQLLE
jgi:ATP-binding cassette subfamily F protein 3